MLTSAGGVPLPFRRFCSAIRPPKVSVSVHEASTMAALGAAALAYSASTIASLSSLPPPFPPGAERLLEPLGGGGWICVIEPSAYDERPNTERNDVQSAVV